MQASRHLPNIQALFPRVEEEISPQPPVDIELESDDIEAIFRMLEAGVAPGPSGLRSDHLIQISRCCKGMHKDERFSLLKRMVEQAAGSHWPSELARWFAGGNITPLRKKDNHKGIRPAVAIETFRCIVSRYALKQSQGEAAEILPNTQCGFSPGRNALQSAIYTARSWARSLGSKILCNVDISNAYITIRRAECCNKQSARI